VPAEVRRGLPILIAGRFGSNVAFRFVYPFLPAIARGLGVSLEAAGAALSIRELSGLTAPAVGRLIDRGRRRAAMVVGLAAAGASLLVTAASPGIVAFAVGMVAFGVAKTAYDAAMSTWIGDHVPFARRGQVIGVSEMSWAAALLIGIPLVGALIDALGWRAPFVALGGLNLAIAVVLPRLVRPDPPAPPGARARLRLLPGALALYATMGTLSFGMQLVIVAHGAWLEDAFGLSVAAIGVASIALGLGELAASGATVVLTDRWGKRRSMALGCAAMIGPLALLGTAGSSTVLAVALLTAVVLAFEFAFVSALPLVTELDPEARGAAVGVAFALVTVARAVGTLAGTWLYAGRGMGWVGSVAAATIAVTLVLVVVAVHEPDVDRRRRLRVR